MPKLQQDRERVLFIDKLDKAMSKRIERLQKEFYEDVRDFYERNLKTDGNRIIRETRNYANINSIDNLIEEFTNTKAAKISQDVANGFTRLVQLNKDYFGGVAFTSKALNNRVLNELLLRYGIELVAGKPEILKGGWVHRLANVADPFRRMQEIGISAVANNIPLAIFRQQIRDAAFDKGVRSIQHHFKTNANDAYAQFDRTAQKVYADELDLICFVYAGGLIDTSRDFCEDRNGQVFTIFEAEEWETLTWQGKNKDYVPLRDMGGHNCRHHPSFISDELAITLRPDLEPIIREYRQRNTA